MIIQFPPRQGVYTPNTTVSFPATIDGTDVACEISTEALIDHFGAISIRAADLIAAFEQHRQAIEAVARRVIPHRIVVGGRCLLISSDFPR